jgi:hypothetical protein
MAGRAEIIHPNIYRQRLSSALDSGIINLTCVAGQEDRFAGENSLPGVWNFCLRQFDSIKEYSPGEFGVCAWNWTKILNLHTKGERSSFGGRYGANLPRIRHLMLQELNSNSIYADVWSVRGVEGVASHLQLKSGNKGIQKDQSCGHLRPKNLFLALSAALIIGSLYLLSKTLDYVYLKRGFNVNLAVVLFFLALGLFLCGGWLLGLGVGFI